VIDYPWFKLTINRLANLLLRWLFRVKLNDVTNAFQGLPQRRRSTAAARFLSPHFNLTIEIPLKAIVRGLHLDRGANHLAETGARGRPS